MLVFRYPGISEMYFTRNSKIWETPRPSQRPRDPPRSARKVVQLKAGNSEVCLTTSGSKEKEKVVVSPAAAISDISVPTVLVDRPGERR